MENANVGGSLTKAIQLWLIQTLCVVGLLSIGIFVYVNLFGSFSLQFPHYQTLAAVTYEYVNDKGGTVIETVEHKSKTK